MEELHDIMDKQIRDRGIGGSTAEGIQLLQEDPKLRKKFLEGGTFNGKSFPKASFEGKADPTVRDLLDKNSFIAKSFKDGIDLIGGAADAQKTYNSIIAEKTGQSLEKVMRDSSRTKYLNADQALEYGLVDKILRSEDDLPQKPTFLSAL